MQRSVLLVLLAFARPAVQAQGGCSSVADISCPATDPVTPVRDGYDPAAVDWNAVVDDLKAVWDVEPRFCNFAIRAWFHDIDQHFHQDQAQDHMPFDGGSDASFITDLVEAANIEASRHGFGQFARHIIVPVARAHGASHADVLTIAAAKCTTGGLGGKVDIASRCEAQGFPLYVGKLDYVRPEGINDQMIETKSGNPPTSHTRMTGLLEMFNIEMNSWVEKEQWKVTPAETTAMMGAHTLVMTYACATTGEAPDEAATPDLGDRTCGGAGGRQRMFTWDNSFFMDVTAGRCLQDAGQNGRDFTAAEKAAFTQCGFKSMEGFELNENLECTGLGGAIDAMLAGPDGESRLSAVELVGSLDDAWRDVVWRPGDDAAPCCGLQCETCEDATPEKFWCGGGIDGTARFWPYTYMDCEFNEVYNLGGEAYCAGGEGDFICPSCQTQCDFDWVESRGHAKQDFIDMLDAMQAALVRFRESSAAWEEEYATAFCKLSSFGASFAPGKVSVEKLFTGPSQGCLSSTESLSLQQCSVCDLAHYDKISGVGGRARPPSAPVPRPADAPDADAFFEEE